MVILWIFLYHTTPVYYIKLCRLYNSLVSASHHAAAAVASSLYVLCEATNQSTCNNTHLLQPYLISFLHLVHASLPSQLLPFCVTIAL